MSQLVIFGLEEKKEKNIFTSESEHSKRYF
jgi:hypothetical protein